MGAASRRALVNCMLDVWTILWLEMVRVCCGVEKQSSMRPAPWAYICTVCRSYCFYLLVLAKLSAVNGKEALMEYYLDILPALTLVDPWAQSVILSTREPFQNQPAVTREGSDSRA